jgi:glycosyltransferase involved in cell wall biosynthesis
MKILIASDHYPPFIGGAQRQTKVLAAELHARGHDVAVATVWQDDLPAQEDDEGVRVFRLRQLRTMPALRGKPRRRHQPPFADPVTVRAFRKLLAQFDPDIVHTAGWYSFSVAAAMKGTDTPLLASARDYGFSCANTTLIHQQTKALCSGPSVAKCMSCSGAYYGVPRGWLAAAGVLSNRAMLEKRLTGLHSVSGFVREMMDRDFLNGASAATPREVIPSFRVEEDGARDPSVLDRLPDEPFILFVGALRRVKGVEVLLEAYQRLENAPPLVLVGTVEHDTPPMPPGVVRVDGLPHWAVLAAWERSLFGVMPSLWPEPFGSVIHEAMSRGRAVIGTVPGGHSDMISDESTGLLVRAGDVDELQVAMQRLVSDDALRERLGARALERSESFTARAVVPRFEALYERLAA